MHLHPKLIVFAQAHGGVSAIVLHLAEALVVLHHSGAAGLMMFESDKAPIAVARG